MRGYGALGLWSTVLMVVGAVGVVLVGSIVAAVEAVTFGRALAMLLIGGPLAALFASWPIALGKGPRTLANMAVYVQGQQGRVSEGKE